MALVGNLKDLKLPNLIQLNCLEKNVAKLSIEYRNTIGEIYFDNGQIVHAVFGQHIGDNAVRDMLSLKEGYFRIENDLKTNYKSVQTPWSNLLLDSLREIDEEKDTESGKIKDILQSVLAIRGVLDAEILDKDGRLLASSVEDGNREGYSFLSVFSFKEGELLTDQLKYGKIDFLVLKALNSKIACFKNSNLYVVVEFNSKLQIDNLISELRRYNG